MKPQCVMFVTIILLASAPAQAVNFSLITTDEADSWIELQKFDFKTATSLGSLLEITFLPSKSCGDLAIKFEVENGGVRDGSEYLRVFDTRAGKIQRATMSSKIREGGLMRLVSMQCKGGEDGNKALGRTLFYPKLPASAGIDPDESVSVSNSALATGTALTSDMQKYDFTGLRASDSNVDIAIDKTVLPGNPSYFPTAPGWGEYVVTAKIKSTLTIKGFQMVTNNGAFVPPAQSAAELENPPEAGKKESTLKSLSSLFKSKKPDARKQAEFSKRVPSIGSKFDGESLVRGSAFFPLTESPRAFVLEYTTSDGTAKQLRINI